MSRSFSRAAGLALGVVADRVVADPRRFHPVAGFGTIAAGLESRIYRPTRARGVVFTGVLVGATVTAGLVAERLTLGRSGLHVLATAASTWVVLGGSSLEREGRAVSTLLEQGRLNEARRQLTHLVGRDTRTLDADEIARAAVESVAENTSDAVVAPLMFCGLAGAPGLLGYRAANTLDAMVGHRNERYDDFGWASARLDDLLNLPGARLTALLAAALGPDLRGALEAWRRDASGHPSPNAGPVEAAFAGALGLRLGGSNTYGDRIEHSQTLGSGSPPTPYDVGRALDLARRVDTASALVAVLLALTCGRQRRQQ